MESNDMTAIQILEKLGADASLDPSSMSEQDRQQIAKLVEGSKTFNAVLTHAPAEEPDSEEDDSEDDEKS
jgi:hypothetical protein